MLIFQRKFASFCPYDERQFVLQKSHRFRHIQKHKALDNIYNRVKEYLGNSVEPCVNNCFFLYETNFFVQNGVFPEITRAEESLKSLIFIRVSKPNVSRIQ